MANYSGTSDGDVYFGGPDADHIEGLGGDDGLYGGGGDDEIFGGDGSDHLFGDSGNDLLEGGEGDDLLDGRSGIDILRGQGGNDWLALVNQFGSASTIAGEVVDGGEGVDTLEFNFPTLATAIAFTIADPSVPQNVAGATLVNVERLWFISGAGDDHITGGALDDYIRGLGGNDVINGGDDFDQIFGDDGNDVLSGDAGADILRGEFGDDQLFGGAGNDSLTGGSGIDFYDGGSEIVSASAFGDQINFFERRAIAGVIADLRTGQIANDGFGNAETMIGIETLGHGTAFADQFYGNDSRNILNGGSGDTVMGFGGDDRIFINGGPALLDGGAGVDDLRLALSGGLVPDNTGDGSAENAPTMTTGYTIDLAAGTLVDGHGAGGSIAGIERVTATELDDVLRGGGVDEWFAPGRGSDTIDGRGGVDTLSYADATHYAYYYDWRGGIFVDLQAGQVIETFAARQFETRPLEDRAFPPAGTVGPGATAESTDMVAGIENIEATGLGDTIYGDGNDNRIAPGAGNDVVDGRGGVDTIDYSAARAAVVVRLDQGTASESGTGDTQWDFGQDEFFGAIVEADDHSASTDQLANIENAIGTAFADLLVGDSGANRLEGGDGNDQLRSGAGIDSLVGGGGNDVLYFGAALSAGDVADGGDGRDSVVLQGNVTVVLSGTNLVGIESISIQSGANATFGDTANNFYDFDVTTADGNVAAGQQLIVNAQSLRAGEDFTFDGSAETDGKFLIYGGHGTDNLTGGDGVDVFFFEGQRWTAGDKVDGGDGRDALVISGGSGLTHIEFAADSFTNIESISVNNRYATDPSQHPSYELVLHNGNVAPGATLIVNGSSIALGQVVNIDGRAVQDGNLVLFGGGGHDVLIGGAGADLIIGGGGQDSLTGGAGADTFRYDAVSDSPAGATDLIADFQTGTDKIDLSRIDANSNVAGDQAFSWIGASAFSGAAGELRVRDDGGYRYVEGDTNGDGTADFAIAFYAVAAPQVLGDFVL